MCLILFSNASRQAVSSGQPPAVGASNCCWARWWELAGCRWGRWRAGRSIGSHDPRGVHIARQGCFARLPQTRHELVERAPAAGRLFDFHARCNFNAGHLPWMAQAHAPGAAAAPVTSCLVKAAARLPAARKVLRRLGWHDAALASVLCPVHAGSRAQVQH